MERKNCCCNGRKGDASNVSCCEMVTGAPFVSAAKLDVRWDASSVPAA